MRLEQLHYLLELYKTRSFSKAAENVFITQPSLSTAISTLEEELGVKLFERMRSGVYPTPVGEEVVKTASELLKNEARIYEIAKLRTPAPFSLTVLTLPAVSYGVLTGVMREFQKKYPKTSITLKEYTPAQVVYEADRKLTEMPGTFALCGLPDSTASAMRAKLEQSGIDSIPLYSDRFVAFVGKTHPAAQAESITDEQFIASPSVDLNLLRREIPPNFFTEMHEIGFSKSLNRLKQNTHIEVDTLANLKQLVISGVGVAVMPELICYNDRDFIHGHLHALPFKDTEIKLQYYLLYSTRYPLKPMEKDFIEMVKVHFKNIVPPLQQKNA